jgi:hypothetical protein
VRASALGFSRKEDVLRGNAGEHVYFLLVPWGRSVLRLTVSLNLNNQMGLRKTLPDEEHRISSYFSKVECRVCDSNTWRVGHVSEEAGRPLDNVLAGVPHMGEDAVRMAIMICANCGTELRAAIPESIVVGKA